MKNKIKSIQVIGSGCANCKKMHRLAVAAAKEISPDIKVTYSDNVQEALVMGVMQIPVLAVNNKAVLAGSVPDQEKIKEVILKAAGGCGCSGDLPCAGHGSCGCGC
jgi:glutaredoxin